MSRVINWTVFADGDLGGQLLVGPVSHLNHVTVSASSATVTFSPICQK